MPTNFDPDKNKMPQGAADLDDDAIWDLLSLYADGEATPEQAAQVESLLNFDPRLAQDLQFLRMTTETVQTFAEVEPPVALRDAIFAATTRRQTVGTRLLAFWGDLRQKLAPRTRYAMAFGSMAAATLVAGVLWSHTNSPYWPGSEGTDNSIRASNGEEYDDAYSGKDKPQPEAVIGSPIPMDLVDLTPAPPPALTKLPQIPNKKASVPTPQLADYHPPVPNRGPKPPDQNKPIVPAPDDVISPDAGPTIRTDAFNRHMPGPHMTPPEPISNPVANDPQPQVVVDHSTQETKVVVNHPPPPDIKVTVPKLPPETYQFLTNAQMKQQQKASTLGYDRDTVKSIQRKELTVSIIHGNL